MSNSVKVNRRQFIASSAVLGIALLAPTTTLANSDAILKPIPKTGEQIPVVGMGSSRTLDIAGDNAMTNQLQEVLQTFFDMGGGMLDSSPMYGTAERAIGQILPKLQGDKNLFSATKVWTYGEQQGVEQMQESLELWGIERFDLMQIHNLRDWQIHLATLHKMKADKQIRYIGITTSHGRYHRELADIMRTQDIDFVQLTYNITNRQVESQLLEIAQEKGIAVIANRPFDGGNLFRKVKGKTLPEWSKEFDCQSWGQFFLKFVVSHPAITCAIPATSKIKHLVDNMQAGRGRLPSAGQRKQMLDLLASL